MKSAYTMYEITKRAEHKEIKGALREIMREIKKAAKSGNDYVFIEYSWIHPKVEAALSGFGYHVSVSASSNQVLIRWDYELMND